MERTTAEGRPIADEILGVPSVRCRLTCVVVRSSGSSRSNGGMAAGSIREHEREGP